MLTKYLPVLLAAKAAPGNKREIVCIILQIGLRYLGRLQQN